MRTDTKIVHFDVFGFDPKDFSNDGRDYCVDPDFDRVDGDVFRDLHRPINPRRKPCSDGGFF
ncbi:hypothetical protein [Methylobacterium sp. NEAU K]|jgi:hypothetical protein|uniref:hypothetical protein n=1 Tax=Methylobacterium sp. NEAU K TaxID=3064946 RepID=UPI001DE73735|nr:hypothetical protein [Methylobacterium sp. NEAU K]MBY0251545.1 hypothetical protein [Methylobacterium organophilum]MDP4004830.1 hypothetical protein [Methylobacterium sp. NEAU K]